MSVLGQKDPDDLLTNQQHGEEKLVERAYEEAVGEKTKRECLEGIRGVGALF